MAKMTREDLLKFTRATKFVVVSIEDDSSEEVEGKILTLAEPVKAVSSIPLKATGKPMEVTTNVINVAGENVDEMLEGLSTVDGVLTYQGAMHLDVSQPRGRANSRGEFEITKAPKVWLTKTKFSRFGGQSRASNTEKLNVAVAKMFSSPYVVGSDTASTVATPVSGEPKVVENGKQKEADAKATAGVK